MRACPRIVIAGTQSGVGKTSVALGITAALTKRGLKVQTFKTGPDFLDPTYLAIASGRVCYNLDSWMTSGEYVRELFSRATADADIAVIEGAMGLFDSASPTSTEGSTADIARILSAPVLLVLNARGLARSIAAMVKGYYIFDPDVQIAGVMANWCGSDKHERWLSESLEKSSLPPLLGAIPKDSLPSLPRRHLGLVSADEKIMAKQTLEKLASAMEKHARMDEIIDIGKAAVPTLSVQALATPKGADKTNGAPRVPPKVRVGIARDEAFHFYYQDAIEAMERMGCEFAEFSPINDEKLPEDISGIYIGGGYPEEHAEKLSQNGAMLKAIKSFAISGRPIYAECAGLVYLSRGVELLNGAKHRFAGFLPSWTKMRKRFKSLGYVEVTLTEDSLLGSGGSSFRGHRFHYSELIDDPAGKADWKNVYSVKPGSFGPTLREGYSHKNVLASYVHAHLASQPQAIKSFLSECEAMQ